MHFSRGIKPDDRIHVRWVVVGQVTAGPDTDFEHTPARLRNQTRAFTLYGRQAARAIKHVRQDIAVVQTHAADSVEFLLYRGEQGRLGV